MLIGALLAMLLTPPSYNGASAGPMGGEKRGIAIGDSITIIVDYPKNWHIGNVQRRERRDIRQQVATWAAFNAEPVSEKRCGRAVCFDGCDRVTFKVPARVIDIRANGDLVIEARRHVVDNEDNYERPVTGVVRREKLIVTANAALSEDVTEVDLETSEVRSCDESCDLSF